jgi:SAM-dependent methyltransferase
MLMTQRGRIIGLAQWLATPAGRYLLAWEQQQLDACVADVFGFHALQVGLPQLEALRANRMPHRWLAVDESGSREPDVDPGQATATTAAESLCCDFDALPFAASSLDLVVLPHALELAHDPHRALAEVDRVLMPEGRVVIVGFNPVSLWGAWQGVGRVRRWFSPGSRKPDLFLPEVGEFLGPRRLRDWLRLLSFEVEGGRFGCYRPPVRSQRWLDRYAWTEDTGQHWWPVFGAAYVLVAVKRVRGMRLVGLARGERAAPRAAPAVAANREGSRS